MSDKQAELLASTRTVIESFTSQGFMFTALDISNEVKRHVQGVRHREISPLVRTLFEDGAMGSEYTRTSIDVVAGGKTVQALLYYDQTDDPEDYGGSLRRQRAVAPVADATGGSAAAPEPIADPGATPVAPSNPMSLSIDRDGRAAIPGALLRRAGITEDTVHLDSAGFGSGLVVTAPEAGGAPLAELEYEGDAVYIPRRYLAALDTSAPLVARVGTRAVEIEGRIR